MASLNEVCTALAVTAQNYCDLGEGVQLSAYDTPSEIGQLPGIIVEPEEGDYTVSMSGDTTWLLRVYVLCSTAGTTGSGLKQLNSLIDGWGPASIRQIVYEHGELGLSSTTAFVKNAAGYSGAFEVMGLNAVGAILTVEVTTDSRQQGAQQ